MPAFAWLVSPAGVEFGSQPLSDRDALAAVDEEGTKCLVLADAEELVGDHITSGGSSKYPVHLLHPLHVASCS